MFLENEGLKNSCIFKMKETELFRLINSCILIISFASFLEKKIRRKLSVQRLFYVKIMF